MRRHSLTDIFRYPHCAFAHNTPLDLQAHHGKSNRSPSRIIKIITYLGPGTSLAPGKSTCPSWYSPFESYCAQNFPNLRIISFSKSEYVSLLYYVYYGGICYCFLSHFMGHQTQAVILMCFCDLCGSFIIPVINLNLKLPLELPHISNMIFWKF